MKKTILTLLVLSLFVLTLPTALAQETVNQEFGAAYDIPEDWISVNEETLTAVTAAAQTIVDSDALKQALDSIDPTNMVMFFTDGTLSASVNIVKQDMSGVDFDALYAMRQLIADSSKASYEQAYGEGTCTVTVRDEIETFGDNRFFVIDNTVLGVNLTQYLTVIDEHLYIVTFSGCDDAQLKDGQTLLSSFRVL